jgi:hypothetical protein
MVDSLRARVRAGERLFDDWLWRSRLRRPAQYRLLQAPLLNDDPPLGGPDKLVVLLDSSVVVPEQRGLYRGGDRVLEDEIAETTAAKPSMLMA